MFRALLLTLCFALPAAAGDHPKAECKAPAWAPKPIDGYALDGCSDREWTPHQLETTDGNKQLEGSLEEVTYVNTDEKKNVSNKTAWQFFVDAATQAGATLKSNKQGGWGAVLERKSGKVDEWLTYRHGSGNEQVTGSYTLATFRVAPLKQEVKVKVAPAEWDTKMDPCVDPPWLVAQFSYFKRSECNHRDFDSVTFNTAEGHKTIAGRVLEVDYTLSDESKVPVANAVRKNYVDALTALGAKLVSKPDDGHFAALTQKTPVGDVWYLYSQAGGNDEHVSGYRLVSIQVGAPPVKRCVVQVYGVNFDFNKATLRPDSEPVLEQVLAMFKGAATYAAEIGGHTDDVGDAKYNQTLSGERADAVKAWLVAHGVDAGRMTTAGFGMTRPLVPNTNDESRAKNRRVELKRKDCK